MTIHRRVIYDFFKIFFVLFFFFKFVSGVLSEHEKTNNHFFWYYTACKETENFSKIHGMENTLSNLNQEDGEQRLIVLTKIFVVLIKSYWKSLFSNTNVQK